MSNIYADLSALTNILRQVPKWLDKAEAHAKAKSFDPELLLSARLAPDQYALVRQIQSACDGVKFGYARLSATKPPVHPDNEQTLAQIRARIETALSYAEGFNAQQFEGSDERLVPLPFRPGKAARGGDYLRSFVAPNFYFHVTTTYAILRHNGVDLGKSDFIASVTLHDLPA